MEVDDDRLVNAWTFEMRYPAAGELTYGNAIKIRCFGTSCRVESKTPKKISELKKYADKVDNFDKERSERLKKYEEIMRKYLETIEE